MTIQTSNLMKKYNRDTYALKDVSLSIDKGIFGLLGRNGSGKTTLLRILTTLLEPTSGSVNILGLESNKQNQKEIKNSIGYMPQEFGFYKEFTVQEILRYICIMRGIDRNIQESLIKESLVKVTMYDDRKKKCKQLSGGMKRRVGLAQAMLGNPPILIVDEPTAGVDPEERIKIRKLLSLYAQDNTVLLSTHIVEDIEHTCNNLAILDGGNVIYSGSLTELLKKAEGNIVECSFSTIDEFQAFEREHSVLSFKRDQINTKAIVMGNKESLPHSKIYYPSLEEAYVYITSREVI